MTFITSLSCFTLLMQFRQLTRPSHLSPPCQWHQAFSADLLLLVSSARPVIGRPLHHIETIQLRWLGCMNSMPSGPLCMYSSHVQLGCVVGILEELHTISKGKGTPRTRLGKWMEWQLHRMEWQLSHIFEG